MLDVDRDEIRDIVKIMLVQARIPPCDCPPEDRPCGHQYGILSAAMSVHGFRVETDAGVYDLKCVNRDW